MAYSLTQYILRPEINLHGIVGIPIQLNSTMFTLGAGGAVLDPSLFPDILYCTGGAVASSGGYVTVNNSGSGAVGLVVGTPYMYTITAKGSLQKPISISTIKTILGVSTNDLKGLNTSPAINQLSQYKPTGNAPYHMSEWINYCHTATAGLSIVQNNGDTDVPTTNPSFKLGCSVELQDLAPLGFDTTQGVKIDFYNNTKGVSIATLTDSTPMNYFKIFATTATETNVNGGNNSISINAYMKKETDELYYLVASLSYNIFIELNTAFSFATPSYYGTNFNLSTTITNGASVPQSYDIALSILNGNTFECDDTTVVIQPSNSWSGTLSFSTSHTINIATDLYTVRYRVHNTYIWNDWCTNVSYSYFPLNQ